MVGHCERVWKVFAYIMSGAKDGKGWRHFRRLDLHKHDVRTLKGCVVLWRIMKVLKWRVWCVSGVHLQHGHRTVVAEIITRAESNILLWEKWSGLHPSHYDQPLWHQKGKVCSRRKTNTSRNLWCRVITYIVDNILFVSNKIHHFNFTL